jgi:two-component system chemotaxis sensor kinase CheA
MDMQAARAALVQESRELLSQMESALLEMEKNGPGEESINAVFRAAHTIKGSVGLFGLDPIVRFTHALETVLDQVRSKKLPLDPELLSLFLECGDHLQSLIGAVESELSSEDPLWESGSGLVARLERFHPTPHHKAVAAVPALEPRVEVLDPASGDPDSWHISLRLSADVLRSGMDPLSFFRYMGTFGTITHLEVVEDALPEGDAFDPETLYLGFELQFQTQADRQRILDVFEFVSEGSLIRILPPHSKVEECLSLLEELPEPSVRLGEMLVRCKALTRNELDQALSEQQRRQESGVPGQATQLGGLLVSESVVHPVVVEAALQKQKVLRDRMGGESRVVKVEAGKLDALIDLVGELVIAGAAARIATVREGAKASEEAVSNLTTLVEGIRDAALGLRMVPIGEVFQRFPRMVRDLSKELGKKIDLQISGADSELDKSMVDKIVDPLTHIVRNSLDHGIEPETVRVASGKPAEGTLRFNAFADTGSIVVEVSDDGAGISRQKVLSKAMERGIVQPGQELSDREILNLVFEPGFSTAAAVTDLSGRGVGMDVVKRNIEALRGEIELESQEGQGTTIRLRLPLTLAIIDGFQIQVGEASFVLPLDTVQECADLVDSDIHGGILRLRDESLPFLRLRELFSIPGESPARESLVVVQSGQHRLGVVVDHLVGELQAVIKPLGTLFRELRTIGGTTILGDGSVALILDVAHLGQAACMRHHLERPVLSASIH